MHPERITQNDKGFVNDLDYDGVGFRENDFSKIETKKTFCINMFCYENRLIFAIYISDEKLENSMDFLLVIDENKSHYAYIKDFKDLCFMKQTIKTKNTFAKVVYIVLVIEKY